MSLAVLFPGQGTQYPGMLRWLDRGDPLLDALAPLIGDDWRSREADAGWLTGNRVAQCLLTGLGLAAWNRLSPLLPRPSLVAGYSVGELAAFSAAGVFSGPSALRLAARRAELMDACGGDAAAGLLAVSGLLAPAIAALCRTHRVATAICIAADRVIVGGGATDLQAFEAEATAAGARCTRLAVGVASHTPVMARAAAPLRATLDTIEFSNPRSLLVCNLDGQALRRPDDLRRALSAQIAQTVRWDRSLQTIAERRVRCVLEIGPGSSLAQIWNQQFPAIAARSADEFADPQAIADWVAGRLAR